MTTPRVCLNGTTWMDLLDVEFPAEITDVIDSPVDIDRLEWLKDELAAADRDVYREMYLAFLDQIDSTLDYREVWDLYFGTYTDITDFAREMVEGDIPDHLEYYVNFEAIANDLEYIYRFVYLPNGDTAIFEL